MPNAAVISARPDEQKDPPHVVVDVASPGFAAGLCSVLEAAGIPVVPDRRGAGDADTVLIADCRLLDRGMSASHIVAVLDTADVEQLRGALAAGARGLVLRDEPTVAFPAAVQSVRYGHGWLSRELHDLLIQQILRIPPVGSAIDLDVLTPREHEVMGMLIRGISTVEMATQMQLSLKTVKLHVSGIFRKLGVGSRAAAVARVTGHWVDPVAPRHLVR